VLWPEVVGPWSGSRASFVAAAGAGVAAHELLHHVFRAKLAPGALVAGAALLVLAFVSVPLGWCAFAANLGASGPDAWEAFSEWGASGERRP
jgi:hypothetical protein